MKTTQIELVRAEEEIVEVIGEICELGDLQLTVVGGGIADPLFL